MTRVARQRVCRHGADSGFTLIELLITIVIMGAITVPLANLLLAYFLNNDTTTGRVAESHDEQSAAYYFAQDVANLGTRDQTTLSYNQSVWTGSFPAGSCGSGAAAGDQILLMKWDDLTWDGSTQTVAVDSAAYVRSSSSGENQLLRLFCVNDVQKSSVPVVHDLDPSVTPAVSCSTTCTSGAPGTVTLVMGVKSARGNTGGITVTLTGDRRQS